MLSFLSKNGNADFRSKASEQLLNFVKKIPKYFTDGPLPETRRIDILILLLAGIVRNTAGFAWGYSQKGKVFTS